MTENFNFIAQNSRGKKVARAERVPTGHMSLFQRGAPRQCVTTHVYFQQVIFPSTTARSLSIFCT